MKCSICKEDITSDSNGEWDGRLSRYCRHLNYSGHNAEPVNDGRCCDVCNDTVVIPARLNNCLNLGKNNE